MDKVRMLKTSFWKDYFITSLDPIEKLLFLYFITNSEVALCGIYQIDIKVAATQTGIDIDTLRRVLDTRFLGKIHFLKGWIYVRNFRKHQYFKGQTVADAMANQLKDLPAEIKKWVLEIDKIYSEEDAQDTLFTDDEVTESLDSDKRGADERKKAIESIVEHYKGKIKENTNITKAALDKIETRMKEVGKDKLIDAIDRFAGDVWWMEHNRDRGLVWFFRSEAQIARFLEIEPHAGAVSYKIKKD